MCLAALRRLIASTRHADAAVHTRAGPGLVHFLLAIDSALQSNSDFLNASDDVGAGCLLARHPRKARAGRSRTNAHPQATHRAIQVFQCTHGPSPVVRADAVYEYEVDSAGTG